jgi:hypothetical protein
MQTNHLQNSSVPASLMSSMPNKNHADDDIDSDVLDSDYEYQSAEDDESDDDDESDSSSDESSSSVSDDDEPSNLIDGKDDPRVETDYVRFVHSVFCNDEDNVSLANSLLAEDEDDDIEYNPEVNNDDKDDDFELGDEFLNVHEKELQDLIDGVWQTIVGDTFATGAVEEQSNVTEASANTAGTGNQEGTATTSVGETTGKSTRSAKVAASQESAKAKKVYLRATRRSSRKQESPIIFIPRLNGQSSISSVISQIFAGEHPSNITIHGMPIDGLR